MRRLALIALLLVLGVAGLAATAGADDTRTYEIEMFNAFGIVTGSDVRVSGVNVGSVTDLGVNEDKRAVVTVELAGELAVLGEDTICSTEPQSLIAEYFIDCQPAGAPLEGEGATIPAEQVEQTVQPDLVQNTLREPYMARLRLLINEFGTGFAGNPESLNEAIRLGAPALTQLQRATGILVEQRRTIRRLNEDSNTVIGDLASQREEVVRFIAEADETAEISVSRRDDLSRDFELLDDFLAELNPTLGQLETLAVEQTPLLDDLRAAAPQLNTLALTLPPFNRASEGAFTTLGDASVTGRRALEAGARPLRLLAKAGEKAPRTTEILADLLRDIDDPRRIVEIDDRAAATTGRTGTTPNSRDTMGYTGLEGLLNYAYQTALATNQFDQVSHLVHFGLYGVFTGPCGSFSSGHNPTTGEPGVPKQGGGTTTDILEAADCVSWLGPNQPGLNEDLNLPPYDPSVCVDGTSPDRAAKELCTPAAGAEASASDGSRRARLDEAIAREAEALQLPPPGIGGGPEPQIPVPGAEQEPGEPESGGLTLPDLPGISLSPDRRSGSVQSLFDFLLSD